MADENKQNQYALLALVAIVAVVGIVGLTFVMVGVGNERVDGTEGAIHFDSANVAGEVAKLTYADCVENCRIAHGSGSTYNICSASCLETWQSQQPK